MCSSGWVGGWMDGCAGQDKSRRPSLSDPSRPAAGPLHARPDRSSVHRPPAPSHCAGGANYRRAGGCANPGRNAQQQLGAHAGKQRTVCGSSGCGRGKRHVGQGPHACCAAGRSVVPARTHVLRALFRSARCAPRLTCLTSRTPPACLPACSQLPVPPRLDACSGHAGPPAAQRQARRLSCMPENAPFSMPTAVATSHPTPPRPCC